MFDVDGEIVKFVSFMGCCVVFLLIKICFLELLFFWCIICICFVFFFEICSCKLRYRLFDLFF